MRYPENRIRLTVISDKWTDYSPEILIFRVSIMTYKSWQSQWHPPGSHSHLMMSLILGPLHRSLISHYSIIYRPSLPQYILSGCPSWIGKFDSGIFMVWIVSLAVCNLSHKYYKNFSCVKSNYKHPRKVPRLKVQAFICT